VEEEVELGDGEGVVVGDHDPEFDEVLADGDCLERGVLKPTASMKLKNCPWGLPGEREGYVRRWCVSRSTHCCG
jgi:hypothetical protein